MNVAEKVAKGATMLDNRRPSWRSKVDLTLLLHPFQPRSVAEQAGLLEHTVDPTLPINDPRYGFVPERGLSDLDTAMQQEALNQAWADLLRT